MTKDEDPKSSAEDDERDASGDGPIGSSPGRAAGTASDEEGAAEIDTDVSTVEPTQPLRPEVILENLFRDDPDAGRELLTGMMVQWSGALPPPYLLREYPVHVQQLILDDFEQRFQSANETDAHARQMDIELMAIQRDESRRRDRALEADIKARDNSMLLSGLGCGAVLITLALVVFYGFRSDNAWQTVFIVALLIGFGLGLLGQLGARGSTEGDIEGVRAQTAHVGSVGDAVRRLLPGQRKADDSNEAPTAAE